MFCINRNERVGIRLGSWWILDRDRQSWPGFTCPINVHIGSDHDASQGPSQISALLSRPAGNDFAINETHRSWWRLGIQSLLPGSSSRRFDSKWCAVIMHLFDSLSNQRTCYRHWCAIRCLISCWRSFHEKCVRTSPWTDSQSRNWTQTRLQVGRSALLDPLPFRIPCSLCILRNLGTIMEMIKTKANHEDLDTLAS